MTATQPKQEAGIPCPRCGSTDAFVTHTRPLIGRIKRRKECVHCGKPFITVERFHVAPPKKRRLSA